jgi:hypothetical protein
LARYEAPKIEAANNETTKNEVKKNQAASPGTPLPSALTETITRALQSDGFTRVKVSALNGKDLDAHVFHVSVEPSAYRQSSLFAMGRAIKVWLQALESIKAKEMTTPSGQLKTPNNELLIALTYLGRPILAAKTSEHCAKLFRSGHDVCSQDRAIELLKASDLPSNFAPESAEKEELEAAQLSRQFISQINPQFELGLALKTAVGTEYGLADYALAAEVGAEVSLANLKPGLGAQVLWRAPVSSSADFRAGGIHYANRFVRPQVEQALLTYWMPINLGDKTPAHAAKNNAQGLTQALGQVDAAFVLSAGSVMHGHTGAQAELYANIDRWSLLSTWGRFTTNEFEKARSPALTSLAYSLEPAKWSLELAAGRFYNLDRGWRLGSTHWFGDTSFMGYVRQSGFEGVSMSKRRFAGFEMSFPLGPQKASSLAGVSVRARDRWKVGLETKVGESDNYITRGYGLTPSPRHGLMDITDHGRAGLEALWAARSAMRLALQ